ncbi:MAG TPA: hypothetical protein VE944_09830 [Nostoc sp.]|uniref:hypothetical protein n=1 Tax=Nostoc sp. TaxID=1180 RepID=UPI002D4D8222|nr:hypothetical protein [Nostoc sp.]HYX14649.1 hypothetical protein [Nostoc sp.]
MLANKVQKSLLVAATVLATLSGLDPVVQAQFTVETPSLPVNQSASTGDANACASLTTASIQAVIDKIIESRNKAQIDNSANGVNGAYASAAKANLDLLTVARDKMLELRDWLYTAGVLDPPPFVTNTSAAYNVHSYVREAVVNLHYARHWATISAVYHKSANARNSYELTTQSLDLIEPLGAQAGRCYMSAYKPFTNP